MAIHPCRKFGTTCQKAVSFARMRENPNPWKWKPKKSWTGACLMPWPLRMEYSHLALCQRWRPILQRVHRLCKQPWRMTRTQLSPNRSPRKPKRTNPRTWNRRRFCSGVPKIAFYSNIFKLHTMIEKQSNVSQCTRSTDHQFDSCCSHKSFT